MTVEFRCAQCNQLLRVPEDAAGKSARCPKCQALMVVPAAAGETMPASMPPPLPTSMDPATAAANPFGSSSAAPAAPSPNPYAPPLATGYSGALNYMGPRPGLPWETKGHNFATWWETAKLCMLQPSYAFSIMRESGGMGQPMLYAAFGLAIGMFGQMLWYIPLITGVSLLGAGGNAGPGELGMLLGVQVVMHVVQSVMGVVMGATIVLLVASAIIHVCLMIVGGAKKPFETTLRVLGYVQGATAWMNIIPGGGLVAFVWAIVAEIIGLARAHETEMGKSALAVFLPIFVCGGCVVAVIAAVVAAAVANSNF